MKWEYFSLLMKHCQCASRPYLNTHMILQRHIIQRMGKWWQLTRLLQPKSHLEPPWVLSQKKNTAQHADRIFCIFFFCLYCDDIVRWVNLMSTPGPCCNLTVFFRLPWSRWNKWVKVYIANTGVSSSGTGHQSSSHSSFHHSLEHNGKSNIIISTSSHKR